MERIVIRHLTGSKAGQVERFPLTHFKEVIIGRDPSATVKLDEETETMVGRKHASISQNPSDASLFFINDLNSRNGTFVNGQLIVVPTLLKRGDIVQCGLDGPYLQFYLEPGTEPLIPELPRVTDTSPPRQPLRVTVQQPGITAVVSSDAPFRRPDYALVEEGAARTGDKTIPRLIAAGGVLVGILAMVATGIWLYRSRGLTGQIEALRPESAQQQVAIPTETPSKDAPVDLNTGVAGVEKDAQQSAGKTPSPSSTQMVSSGSAALPVNRITKPPARTPEKVSKTDKKYSKKSSSSKQSESKKAKKQSEKKKKKKKSDY